jgi:phosphoglycolate phosphatase-like HAD superfamily hydrolase
MNSARKRAVYIDVDDTLVRHAAGKIIPIPTVIDQVRRLHARGFPLYCWSTGGADYARGIATELGIEAHFAGFLPKPAVLIDDQEPGAWILKTLHPLDITDDAVDSCLP